METRTKRTLQATGLIALVAVLSFGAIKATHAQGIKGKLSGMIGSGGHFGQAAASGSVASISGNTITLTGTNGTTYTVDASKAELDVHKPAGTALSNSGIATGDTIEVFGTVSGTNIAATKIEDGVKGHMGMGMVRRPTVGTVSAVNGNSVTLNSNGTTFTVDLTNSKIAKFANNSSTAIQVSDIKTGDTLAVFGTVNGSNIAATNVIDGTLPQGFGMMHRGRGR